MKKPLQSYCLYLKALVFYHFSSRGHLKQKTEHLNKVSIIQTAICLICVLFCYFSYSNETIKSDCYAQFFNFKKSVLKLPQDLTKRGLLWEKIKSDPDKYAEMLNLPKSLNERKKFFEFVEKYQRAPYIAGIISEFHYKINNGLAERSIKKMGIILNPRKVHKALGQTHIAPNPRPQTQLNLVDQLKQMSENPKEFYKYSYGFSEFPVIPNIKYLAKNQTLEEAKQIKAQVAALWEKIIEKTKKDTNTN